MTHVLFLVVMTAITMALIIWPLMRENRSPKRSTFDIKVHEDQLVELQRDFDNGLIDRDQADAARIEIKRRILAISSDHRQQTSANAQTSMALPISLAFLVPVACSTLYLTLGSPELPASPLGNRAPSGDHPSVTAGQPAGSTFQPTAEQRAQIQALPVAEQDRQINAMVEGLEQRLLTSTPNDLDGWMMLGRSRTVLGDREAAAAAYQRALTLVADTDPRRPQIEAKLIEVGGSATPSTSDEPEVQLAVAQPFQPSAEQQAEMQALPAGEQDERIRSMVEGLTERLESRPDDVNGWLMLARSRTVLGEPNEAEAAYRRALALLEPSDPRRRDIEADLAALDGTADDN